MASRAAVYWQCAPASLHALRMRRGITLLQFRRPFASTRLLLRSTSDPTSSVFPIFQPAFWRSILPKRSRLRPDSSQSPSRPHWLRNPATHVIILSLLAGSQAIQILTLKRDQLNHSLRTDAHIAKLREVIGRVQRGEDVDVKKELGTGDEKREKEWEEVMREVAREDEIFARRRRKREEKANQQVRKDSDSEVIGRNEDQSSGEGSNLQHQATPSQPTTSGPAKATSSSNTQIRFY